MPTLTRTWTSSQNNVPADQTTTTAQIKEILLDLKTKMLAAGWTVTQSSDASTADASDRWLATTDITNGTGAHSWIVLRSPANYPSSGEYIYFAIDYDTTTDYTCPFATRGDQDWTGLTTSSGPYDNDTTIINRWAYSVSYIQKSTAVNIKFHSSFSDIGDIIYYVTDDATGFVRFSLIINKLSNTQSADNYPVSIWIQGASNATLAWASQTPYYSKWGSSYSYTKGFGHVSGAGSSAANMAWDGVGSTGIMASPGYVGGSTGDDIGGVVPAIPIVVYSNFVGSIGCRGTLTDIWIGNLNVEGRLIGTVEPGTGTITTGLIGNLWVPCSVAPNFDP